MNRPAIDTAAALDQCDDGAWPGVLQELQHGTSLILLDMFPRYAIEDGRETYGPTLSAKRVAELAQGGLLKPAGLFRYRLARRANIQNPQH